ncbi:MAG: glycosyltransferase [Candidatus Omnitrophica bacterium]|nr:glycosyltransferase [Candidatus Omnitrophota bacterium]
MMNPIRISIILPVYNEEANIQRTVEEAAQWLKQCAGISAYEIVAVNDGSRDNSGKILERLKTEVENLVVVDYPGNKGYGGALVSGIRVARYDWILLMDSDGQFKMDALAGLLEYTEEHDIVAGYRRQRQDNFLRIWLGELYTFLAGAFLKVRLRDINCGFKLFRKSFLDVDGINTHAGAFYTHVFMNAHAKNARIKEVPVAHHPRPAGRSTGASPKVVMMAVSDFWDLLFGRGRSSAAPTRTSWAGKAGLLILGCFLTLVVLEVGMRTSGALITTAQSLQNRLAVRDDSRYRILCVGESTTFFGTYNYAYPHMLEEILNQHPAGSEYRVFNEGQIGTDTDEILEDLSDHLRRYRPHMVIAMMGVNDAFGEDLGTVPAGGFSHLRVVRLMQLIRRHWQEKFGSYRGDRHVERGYEFLSDGDIEEAWAEVERARRAGAPPAEIEALTGHIHWLAAGDFDRSAAAYDKALSLDPGREWLYEDYFQVLYYGNRYEEAAGVMQRMLARFPKSEDAYRKLGKVYLQLKQYDKLEALLQKADEQVPDDPGMIRIRAAYHLAKGETDRAERLFERYAEYERQHTNPRTADNYRILRDTVLASGAELVAVQYPLRDVDSLKAMLNNDRRVTFVSNEDNFKSAVLEHGYGQLFTDQFAGDFGHLSDRGNRLLAGAVAEAILGHLQRR